MKTFGGPTCICTRICTVYALCHRARTDINKLDIFMLLMKLIVNRFSCSVNEPAPVPPQAPFHVYVDGGEMRYLPELCGVRVFRLFVIFF